MTKRISMSKAKRLTESLKSKNRRFQESADSVYEWFNHEWMRVDVSTRKMSELLGSFDENDFKGLNQALKVTFKPTDKVNYVFGDDTELEDLSDLLWKEDKNPQVFRDTYVFQANTGKFGNDNVVFATDGYGNYVVVVGY